MIVQKENSMNNLDQVDYWHLTRTIDLTHLERTGITHGCQLCIYKEGLELWLPNLETGMGPLVPMYRWSWQRLCEGPDIQFQPKEMIDGCIK